MVNSKGSPWKEALLSPRFGQVYGWGPGGLLLSVLTGAMGVVLTGVSGGFITATALVSLGMADMHYFNLFLPSAIIRLLALTKPFSRYFEQLLTHRATLRLLAGARALLFGKVMRMEGRWLLGLRNVALVDHLLSDLERANELYLMLLVPWLGSCVVFVAGMLFVTGAAPAAALPFWLLFPLAALAMPFMAWRTGLRLESRLQSGRERLRRHLVDHLEGYRELRQFDLLGEGWKKLGEDSQRLRQTRMSFVGYKVGWQVAQDLLIQLAMVACFYLLLIHPGKFGHSIPILAGLLLGGMALLDILRPLPSLWLQAGAAFLARRRLAGLEAKSKPCGAGVPVSAGLGFPPDHTVAFENVCFSYERQEVARGLSLEVPHGGMLVITGPNGAGKTTLLNMLSGMLSPSSGRITIGDIPVTAIRREQLLEHIGYLEQQVNVFDTSIYENIALARAGASGAAVEEAARAAGLGRLLAGLPAGIHTRVGQGGKRLSGGQVRMIGLARILLKDAPVLLLDEPAEGLDRWASQLLMRRFESEWKKRTIILVTHSMERVPGRARVVRLRGNFSG